MEDGYAGQNAWIPNITAHPGSGDPWEWRPLTSKLAQAWVSFTICGVIIDETSLAVSNTFTPES